MKKIFTLAAISLMAIGAYAQDQNPKTESWYVNNEDGTLKDVYVANSDPSAMSVVEFSTENVTGTHTSGPIAGYIDGELPLEENVDNSWSGIQTKELSKDGSVAPFYYVQGTGNPVNLEKIAFEEIITDDEPTGVWRANWDDAYYEIDGSNGLPTNGTYVTLTPKVNGTFTVAAWINKGSREIYVVKASDMKALAPNTEVKASGYVNGTNWGDDEVAEDSPLYGYPMYQESIEISDAYVVGAGNQATWGYITFDAEADETYYVFNKSTQIGFSGYEFTPEDNGDGDGNEGGDEGTTSIEESWKVYDIVDGVATLKSDYVANSDPSAMSVVEFSTDNVTGTHTSGPVAGYIDGPELPLAENVDNTWGGLSNKALSADGSIATFYYVQGKGNPVNLAKIDFEEIVTDGVGTGVYRAYWDNAYYETDGSNGLPTNGTYVTLTPKVNGTLTVAAWINKGNREIYVVKASDMTALSFAKGEITASGFNNGITYTADNTDDSNLIGYPMYQEEIYTLDEDGNDTWIMPESKDQQVEAYLTFAATAGETYYVFNKSTQIGFSGFTFTHDENGETSDEGNSGDEGTTLEVDSWYVFDETSEGATLKSDYVPNVDESAMSVVEFSTNKVTGTHTSGPIAGYIDGPELPLVEDVNNTWGGLSNKALSADGSIATFYYVQGKGNPVNLAKIDFEEIVTDGVGTGVYRADWTNSYYEPDGSNGLPTNGTYVTLTPSVDGTFTVAAWINKGDREIYVVKASDMTALSYAKGEIKASGYNNGIVYTEDETADSNILGYPIYQEEFNTLDENGNDTWIMPESTNQQVEAYLTFAATAGETYYVFNKSTQIGFCGFEFEYEDNGTSEGGKDDPTSITEIETSTTNDANAPIYNLAGQRVTKNAKGILIQNGKKFIAK